MRIIYDINALKSTTERLFPYSRHRSKRIHKKLRKRFGGEFRQEPCMFRVGAVTFAHPAFKAQIERATRSEPTGFGYAPDGMPRYTGFLR